MKSTIELVINCPFRIVAQHFNAYAGKPRPVDSSVLGRPLPSLSQTDIQKAVGLLRDPEERIRAAFFTLWAANAEEEKMIRRSRSDMGEYAAYLASSSTWMACINSSVIFLLDEDIERSVAEISRLINSDKLRCEMLQSLNVFDEHATLEYISRLYFSSLATAVPIGVLKRIAHEENDRKCLTDIIVDEARAKVESMLDKFENDPDVDVCSRLGKITDIEISTRKALHTIYKYCGRSSETDRMANYLTNSLEAYCSLNLNAAERKRCIAPARAALRFTADENLRKRLSEILRIASNNVEETLPAEARHAFNAMKRKLNIIEETSASSECKVHDISDVGRAAKPCVEIKRNPPQSKTLRGKNMMLILAVAATIALITFLIVKAF